MSLKLRRLNPHWCFWGEVKYGIEVMQDVIGGQIAKRYDYWYDGRKRNIYTAFYPKDGSWKAREFLKFRVAKIWLIEELTKKSDSIMR